MAYPRPDINEKFGPGAAAYLAAYRKTYNREPVAPQGMAAYIGMHMLLDAVAAAGTTDMAKVRAAAAAMDKPLSSTRPALARSSTTSSRTRARSRPWCSGSAARTSRCSRWKRAAGNALKNLPRKQ